MVAIKNGLGLLGLRTLKSALSQECPYKFRKAKSSIIIGWAWSRMGEAI